MLWKLPKNIICKDWKWRHVGSINGMEKNKSFFCKQLFVVLSLTGLFHFLPYLTKKKKKIHPMLKASLIHFLSNPNYSSIFLASHTITKIQMHNWEWWVIDV